MRQKEIEDYWIHFRVNECMQEVFQNVGERFKDG